MKDQNQCTTQSATLPPFRGLTMILAVSTFACFTDISRGLL
jgi:hypothetical protein